MTQRELVLQLLREHPEGVCMADMERERFGLGYVGRNRVSELSKRGHMIESSRCKRHPHVGPVFSYRLCVPVGQLLLGVSP